MAKQYRYRYIVQGTGPFPVDMLRYDQAWPAREGEVEATQARGSALERHEVHVMGLALPTPARWESFGWRILNGSTEREVL
jgi:hypothetical protein